MKNGIGPQNLGAMGMNPKSKPCGTPLDFNEKLRYEVGKGTLNPGFEKAIKEVGLILRFQLGKERQREKKKKAIDRFLYRYSYSYLYSYSYSYS